MLKECPDGLEGSILLELTVEMKVPHGRNFNLRQFASTFDEPFKIHEKN